MVENMIYATTKTTEQKMLYHIKSVFLWDIQQKNDKLHPISLNYCK